MIFNNFGSVIERRKESIPSLFAFVISKLRQLMATETIPYITQPTLSGAPKVVSIIQDQNYNTIVYT